MCGRVICALSSDELLKIAQCSIIKNSQKYKISYNIGPGRYLPSIYKQENSNDSDLPKRNHGIGEKKEISSNKLEKLNNNPLNESDISDTKDQYGLDIMKWGTINKKGYNFVNARSETSDLYFKNLKRCVLITEGYYEWKKNTSKSGIEKSQPFLFKNSNNDNKYFLIAGLYDIKKDSMGEEYSEFIILTRSASKTVDSIHDRMPVIINEEIMRCYLNENINIEIIKRLADDANLNSEISFYAVGDLVNKLSNEGKDNTLPPEEIKYDKNKNMKITNFFMKSSEKKHSKENDNIDLYSLENKTGDEQKTESLFERKYYFINDNIFDEKNLSIKTDNIPVNLYKNEKSTKKKSEVRDDDSNPPVLIRKKKISKKEDDLFLTYKFNKKL